ncbi:MAG: MFS transporter [Bacteroidales bacterium]|nr:MFS transporter [Bacteroidales bacterium]
MADFFKKTGLPKALAFGYLGVMVFMMSEGLEQNWLSKYITAQGFNSATLFAVYGIAVTLSSWLSGVISETFGLRKTMLAGFIIYAIGVIGYAGVGMPNLNWPVLLATYAIKGLGYPLFAYSFVVWISYRIEQKTLSTAQGWFWFVFTGGYMVLGAYYGAWSYAHLGVIPTLWTALLFATLGMVLTIFVNKSPDNNLFAEPGAQKGNKFKEFFKGLGIIGREPKVLAGGIVRIINTISEFAFVVYMPLYMAQMGLSDAQWASAWGIIFFINIFANLLFGFVGDKLGWRKTIEWFGGVGCAAGVLLFFYAPQILNQWWFILVCGIIWGIMLAAYVPLSALVPSLVKTDKGAAVSVLNLGAGLATFVGPMLVGVLATKANPIIGYTRVTWVMAGLYILSSIITWLFLKEKKENA